MKSLNDLIWDEDVDLEEGKEDEIKSQMKDICIVNSCLGPICKTRKSWNNMFTCII